MWVLLQVAGGVAARLDVDAVVVHPFDALSMQVAVAFGGPNLGDDTFLGPEVVKHFFGLKGRLALLEDRSALQFA